MTPAEKLDRLVSLLLMLTPDGEGLSGATLERFDPSAPSDYDCKDWKEANARRFAAIRSLLQEMLPLDARSSAPGSVAVPIDELRTLMSALNAARERLIDARDSIDGIGDKIDTAARGVERLLKGAAS